MLLDNSDVFGIIYFRTKGIHICGTLCRTFTKEEAKMKAIIVLIVFMFSVHAQADTLGCAGGGIVGGGIGYAIGQAISTKAANGLGIIGLIGGCNTGSRMEDGTYGHPNVQTVVPPPQPAAYYESPVVRTARIQGQYNAYKREERRRAIAAYCEEDPEGCPRASGGSYPYGQRLFGPGGSVLQTPY